MSNDDYSKKYDIIPPNKGLERGDDRLLPDAVVPEAPLGSTYLGRVKWRSIEKLIHAYAEAAAAADAAQHALAGLDRARLERERVKRLLADAESIHARDASERKVKRLQAQDELEEAMLNYELRARERELKRRQLEAEPQESPKPRRTRISKIQEMLEAEQEMRAWFETTRQEEIRKAGGEERLSDAQRKMLEDLEMLLDDEILKMRTGEG